MASNDMDLVVNAWRTNIKGKQRAAISLPEKIMNRLEAIKARRFFQSMPLNGWKIREALYHNPGEYEYIDKDWRDINVGDPWGGAGISAFFKNNCVVPKAFANKRVVLRLYLGGDSLLYINGEPYHGMDPFRNEVEITSKAVPGKDLELFIESYSVWHSGETSGESRYRNLMVSEIAVLDDELDKCYWDLLAGYKVPSAPGLPSAEVERINTILSNVIERIEPREPDFDRFKQAVLSACALLPEIYPKGSADHCGLLRLVGHSHLDVVFMWQYKEFIRKLGRTHATALRLMEQHPEFIFCQSQALMYAEMQKHYPTLFEQVKKRVKEGRWEIVGESWVEWDGNLLSGESYVRQIMYGKKFYQEAFGITPEICWQPDIFGMTWSLPQILVKSGLKYAVTYKMSSWNDTNPWKKNAFWWQGPDGTRIFTVVPATHFIGMCDPDHLAMSWQDFNQKSVGEIFYTYGWGDGGGGSDTEMIECAKRYGNMAPLFRSEFSTVLATLKSMEKKTDDIPIWNDELYLEAHRGTYTTKGELKKLNRRCEFLYRDAELWSALCWKQWNKEYPYEQLLDGWKGILANQFHDSLPGSHIHPVYEDLLKEYKRVIAIGESARDEALQTIADKTANNKNSIIVFNSLLGERFDFIKLKPDWFSDDSYLVDSEGGALETQNITQLDGSKYVLAENSGIPSVGYAEFKIMKGKQANSPMNKLKAAKTYLRSEHIDIEINEYGELTKIYDKTAEREVLAQGGLGNHLYCYEDMSGIYDAWDIVKNFTDHEIPITSKAKITVDEKGPLRASVLIERSLLNSVFRQRISIYKDEPYIDFETEVDWREDQKLLKVGFDLALNTSKATYDIAFANIERSTHRSNSYDEAKFEVPGHLWMDMSQPDYGVALITDSKYGYEARMNTMALTLLRSPMRPDPKSDRGIHYFTYRLYPHIGTWQMGDVHFSALTMNNPCIAVKPNKTGAELPPVMSFIMSEEAGAALEAVKKSEDGKALIMRLVERCGANFNSEIQLGFKSRKVENCDLTETNGVALETADSRFTCGLNPYEIATLRIT